MTPLEAELRRMIAIDGPIPLSTYMSRCLIHPQYGYYMTRDPFGAAGDFTTAPEISQMFGELIGLWAASVWRQMGEPARLNLVELGPGRGTLMADALRATKVLPSFRTALSVHLVEISPALRQLQQQTLAASDVPVSWCDLDNYPLGPAIFIANEFYDALPVHQAVKGAGGWHLRMIGIEDDRLAFGLTPDPARGLEENLPWLRDAPVGSVYEWRYDIIPYEIAKTVNEYGGAGLLIDYGHVESSFGETLQAVRGHVYVDPLDSPGEVDLTAHVDFAAVARAAARAGARVHGPITQGDFLRRLGIGARAERLKRTATPEQAADIDAALARLTGSEGMGELFKVLAIAHPSLGPLPGFDS